MDATAFLRNGHGSVRRLFARLDEARFDARYKRLVFRSIKGELEAHARVEEEVFYPALMRLRSSPTRQSVRNALEEHQTLDALVAEIDQMEADDARLDDRLAALRQSVERHIEQEERVLFEQARIHFTDERLDMLGRAMEARRGEPPVPEAPGALTSPMTGPASPREPDASGPGRRAARDR